MNKSKARERALTDGQIALMELTAQGEGVSAKSYVKSLNYLIHFATPRECISYLHDHGVVSRPDNPLKGNSRIINGINCVRKRMNMLYQGFKSTQYKSKREHENKALEYWGKAPKFKIDEWQRYLVQFSEDYKESDDEGSSKVAETVVEKSVVGLPVTSPTVAGNTVVHSTGTATPSSNLQTTFVSAGLQATQGESTTFPPGISYVNITQRETRPLSMNEMRSLSRKEVEIMLNRPREISEHDAAVSAAISSAPTRSDEWMKQFNVAILPGERKYQRERYNQWWKENSEQGSIILPDELIMPPMDATDLLGKGPKDEANPNLFSTPIAERYKQALEGYIGIRTCAQRVVRDCYHKSHRNAPMFVPYLQCLKTSMFNHFTRLSAFTNFNQIKQTAPFMTAMEDIDKCIEKLEDAKLNPDEETDTRDSNSVELPIPFKERNGKTVIRLIILPLGWDEPLLPPDSPEAVQFRKHNSLKGTGSFNGKNPHGFIPWWEIFRDKVHRVPGVSNCDKWEHLVDNGLLIGEALELFLGGSDLTRDDIADRDAEYVYGMSRLCTQYDRADNKWERLWAEVDKLRIDKTDTNSTKNGLFKVLRLLTALQSSKPEGATNDEVARKLNAKRRDIFSGTLLDAMAKHTNKEDMQKTRRKGQYDRYVRKYIDSVIKDITTHGYAAEYTEKAEEHRQVKRLIAMLNSSDKKKIGDVTPEKRVKFDSIIKKSPEDTKKSFRPILKKTPVDVSKLTKTPGFVSIGKTLQNRKGVTASAAQMDVEMLLAEENVQYQEDMDENNIVEEEEIHMDEIAVLQSQVQMLTNLVSNNQKSIASSSPAKAEVAQGSVDVDSTSKLAKELKVIAQVKKEPCFFTHKAENVKHTVWDCAAPQMRKGDDLAKRGQCRICWSRDHLASDCTSQVTVSCDHCQKPGHWQPFCGLFISKAYTSIIKKDGPVSTQAAAAAVSNETLEQFDKKLTNQAIHAAREAEAQSNLAHCSLLSGVPVGIRPNVISSFK
jgi:hypothetical protein